MSATNRGAERVKDDCYVTNPGLALAIVDRLLGKDADTASPLIVPHTNYSVCEPSAGVGVFVKAVKSRIDCAVTAVECNPAFGKKLLQSGADNVEIGDWLLHEGSYDLIIGNPPFNEAEYHVRHAVRQLKPGTGRLAYLLRLNFLGSMERTDFWAKYRPIKVYAITPRPDFLTPELTPVLNKHGKKGTDATEYALFVWSRGGVAVYDKKHAYCELGSHILWERKRSSSEEKTPTRKKRPSKKSSTKKRPAKK